MTNMEKYIEAFVENLDVTAEDAPKLEYQAIPTWDSVGHMGLIAGIEDAFDIEMETDDIVEFGSFAKGIEILKKYDVVIE
ncbi:acyl carrier protein [Selenomonas ruminantium]|uniref:Acyl carrier protein n=1 Tax=Selenomonas ruminantium TaxID=971 RepID=A0A1H0S2Y6_SELRU|nr:acyl carrier protein [Selenomonas ruminantium]SDP35626.1 hypothetical protein SAMN05216366_11522 [Selenomonas ruminantium]